MIISFTFFRVENAYVKDYWNILDYFVFLVGWISFLIKRLMKGTKIIGMVALKASGILLSLKNIKRFQVL